MDRKQHWNHVFETKVDQDVSWFEALPETSLQLLEAAGMAADTCVLDVGGGDSRLVDHLAARGMDCLAVLDVSGAALARARSRLGLRAAIPTWIEADVAGEWTLKLGGSAMVRPSRSIGRNGAVACPSSGIRPTRSPPNWGRTSR